mmetsp:Transcript_37022/g.72267  ORF Transcript_37022/g.72267 Transcript_37022/m.72267 type:complete len:215 (-) Transcript_37022:320-964(-)
MARLAAGRKLSTRCATSSGSCCPEMDRPTISGFGVLSTWSGTGTRLSHSLLRSVCSTHPRISLRGMPSSSLSRSMLPESFLGDSSAAKPPPALAPPLDLPSAASECRRWRWCFERDDSRPAKRAENCDGIETIMLVGSLDHCRSAAQTESIPIETSSVAPPLLKPTARCGGAAAPLPIQFRVWFRPHPCRSRAPATLLFFEDDGRCGDRSRDKG